MIWGSVESMWPPLTRLAKTGRGLRQGRQQGRPLGAGLLVLERPGDEDRDGDVGGPRRTSSGGRTARGHAPGRCPGPPSGARPGTTGSPTGRGGPGRPGTSTRTRPRRPARRRSRSTTQGWPTPDTGVAASGASVPPVSVAAALASSMRLGDPAGGEPVVVDAAGVAGGEQVVGRAHRGDGGQVRRVGARRGQLGQARVADADHADLVVGHPGLVGHDLDGVVGVVVRRVAEQVVGAARAARPPHLQADGGEAGHPGDHGTHVGGGVGQEVLVAASGARSCGGLGQEGRDRVGRPGRRRSPSTRSPWGTAQPRCTCSPYG